jgi:hypothetical protein
MASRNPPQTEARPGGEIPDNPQEDWGDPMSEAAHGANHGRRPERTEAARGQGRRTVERNREIAKGGLYK